MMYTVTISSLHENPIECAPQTAIFTDRNKALSFQQKLMDFYRKNKKEDSYVITIDSDVPDSEYYLDLIKQSSSKE